MIPDAPGKNKKLTERWGTYFGIGVLIFLFIFTHTGIQGQNDLSRFVTIDSLINRGTWQIDGSEWAQMKQKRDGNTYMLMTDITRHPNGHFYSSKPPVLSFVGAGLCRVFQWMGADIRFDTKNDAIPAFVVTWMLVGTMTALVFCKMRKHAGALLSPQLANIATLLALGGTLFLSYSSTFNNHTIGAGLILLSFFQLGMHDGEKPPGSSVFLAGLLMGGALVIDIPAGGAFGLMMGLYLLCYIRSFKKLLVFGLGAFPAIALHCALQYSIWGSVLPVQLMGGLGGFEGSYWQNPLGADAWVISRWKYWLLTLFSTRGLFVLSPVLLFGVAGLIDVIRRGMKTDTKPEKGKAYAALTVAFAMLIMVGYYSFKAPDSFGGACFGFRWYIALTPVLAWYVIHYVAQNAHNKRLRYLFYWLGGVSLVYALIGMQYPWTLMEANPHPAVRILMFLRGF